VTGLTDDLAALCLYDYTDCNKQDSEGASSSTIITKDKVACLPGGLACGGTIPGNGVGASVGYGAVGVGVNQYGVAATVGASTYSHPWRKEAAGSSSSSSSSSENEVDKKKEVSHVCVRYHHVITVNEVVHIHHSTNFCSILIQ